MTSKLKQAVIVDTKDNVLRYKDVVETHHNPVPLHRAISVVIFNKSGKKMLLQKRASCKKTWPLFWSNTVCTNVRPKETYIKAATRRLNEEMGIKTSLKEDFKFIYQAKYNRIWGEYELDHVFVGKYEGRVTVDPKEAADYQWITLGELKKDLKKNPGCYTPWFKIIVKKLES